MLPTPAKFHYIFNLRDLSRIWQGMTATISTVVDSPKVLMASWKHECTRVIADRWLAMMIVNSFIHSYRELINASWIQLFFFHLFRRS